MRGGALLAAAALAFGGCKRPLPGPEASVPDVYLGGSENSPRLCAAALSTAGPLEPEARALWRRALDLARDGAPSEAWAVLRDAPAHPAIDAARAVLALLLGDIAASSAQQSALIAAFPDDACLLQTGALLSMEAGDLEGALARAERAALGAPDDDNAAIIHALLLGEVDPEAAEVEVTRLLARSPDHVGGNLLWMMLLLERGAVAEAIAPMQVLRAAGVPMTDLLVSANREIGQIGESLRVIAELGVPPFVDAQTIARAVDPMAAYRAWLGIGPNQEFVAVMKTDLGDLRCVLFPEEAPLTVASFVGLARGTLPWTTRSGEPGRGPLYNDTTFHRVIPEFMVQGGDPAGDGSGGPGWTFPDEISPALRFDRPGRLAMANKGPGTNGSQFFVTEVPVPHLDGRHTVFGQCDDTSVQIVREVARAPAGPNGRPEEPVVISAIEIRVTRAGSQ